MPVDRHTILQTGVASAGVPTAPRSFRVRITAGQNSGQVKTFGAGTIVVGGLDECDVTLADHKVSRRHAELTLDVDGVRVRDLDSTNGIRGQGGRISDAVVPFGASIEIGDSTLCLELPSAPVLEPSPRDRFGGLVGDSPAMREVFAILDLVSPTEATALVQGESGTGKELVARAIHDHSQRSTGPFVVVDCSAAKEQLIESDLFGHLKGAFTGAAQDRSGAFIEASGGTVFLDEIGELPAGSQAKLLRALEARTVKPLGADREVDIDVRIVAATHRDLRTMVAQGGFRFDLFHRLAVVHVMVPPLRERLDDLPCLIRYFHEGRGDIGGENLTRLQRHAWPGNVRELRNVLERSMVLSRPHATFAELNLWLDTDPQQAESAAFVDLSQPFKEAKEAWNDVFERRYVDAVIQRHGGNVSRAAEAAGLSRRHLRTLLVKHGLVDDE